MNIATIRYKNYYDTEDFTEVCDEHKSQLLENDSNYGKTILKHSHKFCVVCIFINESLSHRLALTGWDSPQRVTED